MADTYETEGGPSPKKTRTEVLTLASPTTLCLRCPSLHNDYQLRNWLFYDNRETLGIADWFEGQNDETTDADASGKQRAIPTMAGTAPLETVYVSFSRKPYFLIESPDSGFLQRLQETFGNASDAFQFKNHPVSVVPALAGVTVASQRSKVEAVEKEHGSQRIKEVSTAAVPQAPAKPVGKMVPRSVRLAKK